MAWQRLKVLIKGEAEPVEVVTTARDWAALTFEEMQTAGAVFRVAHNALVRTGAPVPLDYDSFLETLDGMPETSEEATGALDPTQPEP